MRIRAAEAIPYALDFTAPYASARGQLERREMVLLRLRTDTGLEGLGDAVPLSLRGGAGLARVHGELAAACAELRGATVEPGLEWARRLTAELGGSASPPARAALETALGDLASRAAERPLWRLLGAERAQPVRVNATLVAGIPETVASAAAEAARSGYSTVKLKLGLDPGADVRTVKEVRAAVGPGFEIRIDANEGWDEATAIELLGRIGSARIELCEQPVAGLEAMRRVRRASGARLAADESVVDVASAEQAVAESACDAATVKLSKVGGLSAALAIAELLPTYLSSALDGPAGIAAAAHAAQALPGGPASIAHGLATQALFSGTVARRGCELSGGLLLLPEGHGLGVELDELALERARLPG